MRGDLERRYRRVLRLLPGWYREQWEEDMVAAFLDSWLTGDAAADAYIDKAARPGWAETASVAGLATRLYLGGAGTPRRYFAWGQAVRGAVLAVVLVRALWGLQTVVLLAASHYRLLPGPPGAIVTVSPGLWPPAEWYTAGGAWIVIFAALVGGHYRAARIIAVPAIALDLLWLVKGQIAGSLASPVGSWAFWVLLDLVPVAAMAAFHRDAPPAARRPWLLALPASCLLVVGPPVAASLTGHSDWVPDTPGLCCILVVLLCLARAPRARSRRRADSGAWSLTLVLLGAVAGAYRIVSLGTYLPGRYLHDPRLISVGLAELVILAAAVALVAPDAARAQTALPALGQQR